ncbi:hypothetical protein ACQ4M3_37575 [Leptolyngbya sp. AN03gr2]|uniref:hypothetical protein n=1 Tax=unclassified Leptolyngbya TaxID=2650499 RepID=UPI003D31252E
MSWHTSLGDRVLEGTEAAFYLSAVQHAIEHLQELQDIDEETDVVTGDRIFDYASLNQKVVLLHTCLQALLDSRIDPPELTSVLEAAAYFPFAFLKLELKMELESEEDGIFDNEEFKYYYRNIVWQVFDEFGYPCWQSAIEEFGEDEEENAFHQHSTNSRLWKSIIDQMANRIFWDRDWMVSSFAPELLDGIDQSFSEMTGLTEEYVTNRLPKVTSKQVKQAIAAIKNWKLEG